MLKHFVITIFVGCFGVGGARAADQADRVGADLRKKAGAAIDRAINYYRGGQEASGSLGAERFGPAVTGLAVAGMLRTKRVTLTDPMVSKGYGFIEKFVRPDGGIHGEGSNQKNYITSASLIALVEANRDGRYQTAVDNAVKFLKGLQFKSADLKPDDLRIGGWDYGGRGRADLSNTSLVLESLAHAGVKPSDQTMKDAIVFIRRTQNYRGEGGNDQAKGADVDMDGGFFYTPIEMTTRPPGKAGEGKGKGGEGKGQDAAKKRPTFPQKTPTGGIPSYGSMTFAGMKSFMLAGLTKDDPRVQAAIGWVKKRYSVVENPGRGTVGLYYYLFVFAEALDIAGVDQLVDESGVSHPWRKDVVEAILKLQKEDGSWINDQSVWSENEPKIDTAYMLIALAAALKQ